jgi:predicted NBD/HSP70 family sugar kinase
MLLRCSNDVKQYFEEMILAIDIGGTKFSLAVFDGNRMVERESRATDADGGRAWMIEQIGGIIAEWRKRYQFSVCGIGFGGPVNFAAQRVVFSTHVGGWRDFDLCGFVEGVAGAPAIMDNDANVGPARELMEDAAFVERYVVDLALGLKAAIMLLNPARIVIGGGISKARDRLFVPLRAELGRQITAWSGARIDVAPAGLGDDSVLYGALVLAEGREG